MTKWIQIISLFFCMSSEATLVRENFWGVRQTGMGNTGVALPDDGNMLWYNPAGLAQVRGFHNQLLTFNLGVDSADTFSRISNAINDGDFTNLFRPDSQFMQTSLRSNTIGPYFGIEFFDNINAYYNIEDIFSANALVDIYSYNDLGLLVGFGLPLGRWVSMGVVGKIIQRSSVDSILNSNDLLALAATNPTAFQSSVFDNIQGLMGTGFGIGINAGFLVEVPMKTRTTRATLGLSVEDLGDTSFTAIGSNNAPPDNPMKVHLGSAIRYELSKNQELTFALDYRNIFTNTNIWKRTHFGIEYKNRFIGIRAGLNQGYPTFGFSFTQPPHTRINFSTYSTEVGDGLWENPRRMYVLEVAIGFNPF